MQWWNYSFVHSELHSTAWEKRINKQPDANERTKKVDMVCTWKISEMHWPDSTASLLIFVSLCVRAYEISSVFLSILMSFQGTKEKNKWRISYEWNNWNNKKKTRMEKNQSLKRFDVVITMWGGWFSISLSLYGWSLSTFKSFKLLIHSMFYNNRFG